MFSWIIFYSHSSILFVSSQRNVNPEDATSVVFKKQLIIDAMNSNKVKIFSSYIFIAASDIGSFTKLVLRVSNSTYTLIELGTAETAIDSYHAEMLA